MQSTSKAEKRSLLQNKQFIMISGAQFVSDLGNWFYTIAISATIYKITGSAFALSLMLLINLVPAAVFSIIGGSISDKTNPKLTMIVSDIIRGFSTLAAISVLYTNNISILYVIAFINSIFGALFTTSRYKIITTLVSKEDMTSAFSKLRILYELTVILGSAIGGIVYSFLGFQLVVYINSATFFVAILFLLFVKYSHKKAEARSKSSYLEMQKEGFREILKNKDLSNLMVYKLFYTVSGGILNVLPSVLALSIYEFGEIGIGYMFSGIGIGSIVGAYFVGRLKEGAFRPSVLLKSGGITAVGWLLLVYAPSFYTAIGAIVVVCIGNIYSHTYIESTSLKMVDSELVGRISGVFQSLTYLAIGLSLTVLSNLLDYNYIYTIIACIALLALPNIYMKFFRNSQKTSNMTESHNEA